MPDRRDDPFKVARSKQSFHEEDPNSELTCVSGTGFLPAQVRVMLAGKRGWLEHSQLRVEQVSACDEEGRNLRWSVTRLAQGKPGPLLLVEVEAGDAKQTIELKGILVYRGATHRFKARYEYRDDGMGPWARVGWQLARE